MTGVKRCFTPTVLRWLSFVVFTFCVSYLSLRYARQTAWYKDRLYGQLMTGSAEEQLRAASALAQVGAQEHLLAGLKAAGEQPRKLAQRALEYVWFNAAGQEAYERMQSAHREAEQKHFPQAIAILDQLLQKYPKYAEGWNRRASVYWQMGDYEKSIADCERALRLNPNHYGAWQGMGVCRLEMGDVAEACRSLRTALKIIPYDETTRHSLRRCEELLRTFPNPLSKDNRTDLI